MLAGCCRLFTKEVNTIYLHVPNGDNLAAHFLWWTYIKANLVLGSLCCNMLPSRTQKHIHSCAHANQHTRMHAWECGSGEWNLVLFCNYKITHRLQRREKALNAWKNMKLPLFQWSRKNSSEKCQQPIAAGFCCRGRHGLWFPHVSFLSHYASSFHPIKHKYGLRSTTQGASWCSFFWEKQTEERGRQRVETDGWRQSNGLMWLCVCVCVSPLCGFTLKMDPLAHHIYASASLCLCVSLSEPVDDKRFAFVLFWSSGTGRLPCSLFKMMIDDVCCIVARRGRGTRLGLLAGTSAEPVQSLPWLPWLRSGSKVRRPERGCEKPYLIPSPGGHLDFHTSLTGHLVEHC